MVHHPAVYVDQLNVHYGKTPILWDISFSIPAGHLVGIVGPNGAGKSSLIQAMLNLTPPLSGQVKFFGSSIERMRAAVAYIPQRASVDWDFPITAFELVLMGRYGKLGLFQRPRPSDLEAARRCLEFVGMTPFAKRQISQLSGGQQQRIFIARALLQDAEVYLMDEPFVGVDSATERMIIDLLQQLKDKGKTILIVHHDLNTLSSYFDWLIMLNMRLIACGPLSSVLNRENMAQTYGQSHSLFIEAMQLEQNKLRGEKSPPNF